MHRNVKKEEKGMIVHGELLGNIEKQNDGRSMNTDLEQMTASKWT